MCVLFQHSIVSKLHSLSKKMKFTASQQILFAAIGIIFVAQVQSESSPHLRKADSTVGRVR